MKRVLITGATGFVGANLTRRLVEEGHEVHLFVRPHFAPWRIEDIREALHLHVLDLSEREAVCASMRAVRPDWLFHLAVHGAYSSQVGAHQMIQTNIVATANLVEAALQTGFEAFVNTGSSSEYGFKDHAPREDEVLEPNSYYAVTKSAATLYCRFVAHSHHVRIPTLRLYSVYGPYEEPTRLLPSLIVHGLHGRLPPLVDPSIARDYVYVDDVVEAYILAATRPIEDAGAIYNVGTGVQTSLRDVVEAARRIMAIEAEPRWGSMAGRAWDTSIWVADSEKIRRELGWQPRHTFLGGFSRFVEWFKESDSLRVFYERRLGLE